MNRSNWMKQAPRFIGGGLLTALFAVVTSLPEILAVVWGEWPFMLLIPVAGLMKLTLALHWLRDGPNRIGAIALTLGVASLASSWMAAFEWSGLAGIRALGLTYAVVVAMMGGLCSLWLTFSESVAHRVR
jgi:NO-binding membrane sensor protein with MHYT domain